MEKYSQQVMRDLVKIPEYQGLWRDTSDGRLVATTLDKNEFRMDKIITPEESNIELAEPMLPTDGAPMKHVFYLQQTTPGFRYWSIRLQLNEGRIPGSIEGCNIEGIVKGEADFDIDPNLKNMLYVMVSSLVKAPVNDEVFFEIISRRLYNFQAIYNMAPKIVGPREVYWGKKEQPALRIKYGIGFGSAPAHMDDAQEVYALLKGKDLSEFPPKNRGALDIERQKLEMLNFAINVFNLTRLGMYKPPIRTMQEFGL